jgi:DNA mismatch repair ATPase MutS
VDGISYFYAEVKRLKDLLIELNKDAAVPLFFLIDEIFKGTNNKERLIGSRSYIKALTGKNGTGLISTHDLELVNLEKEIPGLSNYHFKEEIIEDRMVFNYKIKKGPSPTTNALKIMRLEGLPID